METSEPDFYYLLRHPDGDVIAGVCSTTKHGANAMFGAYRLEATTKETIETLEAFGSIERMESEEELEDTEVVWYKGLSPNRK